MVDSAPLLSVRGLTVIYRAPGGRKIKAVDRVYLDIQRGEVLGLVGESGCGKSSLGKAILRLVAAEEGSLLYDFGGAIRDLRALSRQDERESRRRIQIVFQDPYSSLNPAFTILGSLSDPLRKFGVKGRGERRRVLGELLQAVSLRPEHMDRYPSEFSGGQRQRIGIARALSVDPELVICDEAVSALDVSIRAQILELLLRLKRERGLTYLFISHDLSVVEYISDRIAVMYLGRIVETGEAEDLCRNPLHPYTQALLSAVPVVDPALKRARIVLEGDVPDPASPPPGCPFHPRCPVRMDVCLRDRPLLASHSIGGRERRVACHLVKE